MSFLDVRRTTLADYPALVSLSLEAFGGSDDGEVPARWPPAGITSWAAFDGETMLAKLAVRAYHSWFDGNEVPTAGIAGVAVAPERRGQGRLAALFPEALDAALSEGAVISTLYPTAPAIYRGFGYERVGARRSVAVPMQQLAGLPSVDDVRVRRAHETDLDPVRECYAAWARAQQGPLVRRPPQFASTWAEFTERASGVSVCERDGRITGYAVWSRGDSYDRTGALTVHDLVALDRSSTLALWRLLGSFTSVLAEVHLTTSGDDVLRLALPALEWRDLRVDDYMLRVLDVPGALNHRRTLTQVSDRLDFAVRGDRLGLIDGDYRVEVTGGRLLTTPGEDGGPTFTPQGFALAYAGTQSMASLRHAGHLTGPTDQDPLLDAVFVRAQFHIRDYF